MNGLQSLRRLLLVLFLAAMPVCSLVTVAAAQGFTHFPGRTDPTNNSGFSGESDTIPVSSGMLAPFLPRIPNLQFGFQYSFGKYVRTGRFTADYVLPVKLSADSVVFGEAHAEGWDFRKRPNVSSTAPEGFTTTTSTANNRIDLSFGGGYRTMLRNNTFLGVNGFYDTSRLYDRWYSSGGVGLEMAANVAGDDAIDLNLNWYGNLFNRDVLVNAFRNNGNSFDLEAGYSHALFDRALDLRLKFAGYQFDIGNPVYGWRSGADLTTKNGMFSLRYEYGKDRLNGQYNTVGGFVNVGFRLENLLSGASPFELPEPMFRSPRNLRRMLTQNVRRNWHQPASVCLMRTAAAQHAASGCKHLKYFVSAPPYTAAAPPFTSPLYVVSEPLPTGDLGMYAFRVQWCACRLTSPRGVVIEWTYSRDSTFCYTNALHFTLTPGDGSQEYWVQSYSYLAFAYPPVDFVSVVIQSSGGAGDVLPFGPGGGISFELL